MAKIGHSLKTEIRTVTGKKVKQLRNKGLVPATVYGKDFEPISIQFSEKELDKVFHEVKESGLVELQLEDKKFPVLFRNPQYHPVNDNILHVDCYKVNLKEKITSTVPIEFVGESAAVKAGNVLVEVTMEVEVEALPTDLPEKIVVDLAKLETLESIITVADLEVDKSKVEIKTHAEQVIVKVDEPKVEEEPVVAEVAPTDVPATAQKAPEEGGKSEANGESKSEAKKEK